MYLNLTGARQSGRTTALVKIATGLAMAENGYSIMFMADTRSTPHVFKLIDESLKAAGATYKRPMPEFILENNSRILVVSHKGPGRGRELDCAIIDNVDLLPKKDQIDINIGTHSATMRITSSLAPFKF